MYSKIANEIDLPSFNIHYFRDSLTTLQWIKRDPENFKILFRNRILDIRKNSNVGQWRHVKSEFNSADVTSRSQNLSDLIHNQNWFQGPPFLSKPISDWTIDYISSPNLKPNLSERRTQLLTKYEIGIIWFFQIFQKVHLCINLIFTLVDENLYLIPVLGRFFAQKLVGPFRRTKN